MNVTEHELKSGPLVIATHNAGKFAEFSALIEPFGLAAVSAADLHLPVPPENGASFEENAYTKAFAAARATGRPALADDSGLSADALGGHPGVRTAEWAETGHGKRDYAMAMEKLHDALVKAGAQEAGDRRARFIAVLCLAWPDGHAEFYRGEVAGHLVWPPRGSKGMGFDPIFQPDGHGRTFGEMEAQEKHGWDAGSGDDGLSHRARAFSRFAHARLGANK